METSDKPVTISYVAEGTSKIAEALAKAQGQIRAAKKTSENPAFSRNNKKSMYADIAEVIEVIQGPASENGLSVLFDYDCDEHHIYIHYILMHSSGEKIVGTPVPMFLRDKTVHGFGASNTFMRRQLLKSIYQIPEEDDDGNGASLKEPPKPPQKPLAKPPIQNFAPKSQPPKVQQTNPQSSPQYKPEDYFDPPPPGVDEFIPEEDFDDKSLPAIKRIMLFAKRFDLENETVADAIQRTTGHKKSENCSEAELLNVLNYLKMKL